MKRVRWRDLLRTATSMPRDRLLLTGASVGSVVVPFALAPIWSRVYPVDYFAVSAVAQVVPGLVASWATLAYHNAIQTPTEDEEAFQLVALSLGVVLLLGLVTALALTLVGGWFGESVLRQPRVTPWLWVSGPLIAATAITVTLDQWLIRRGQLKRLAVAVLTTTLIAPVIPAIGLLAPERTNYILLGVVVGTSGGAVLRVLLSGVIPRWIAMPRPWGIFLQVARKYRAFPRDIAPGNLLTNISGQLPQVALARHFSPDTVGQFARAANLLVAPSLVLGKPTAAVFMRDGGRAYRERGDARAELRDTLAQLAGTFLPVYVITGLAAPWLYPWFFGPAWHEAGLIAQPLAVYQFAAAVGTPTGGILAISGHTSWDLRWQVARVVTIAVTLLIGVGSGDLLLTLWTLALTNVVLYGVYLSLSWRAAHTPGGPAGAGVVP